MNEWIFEMNLELDYDIVETSNEVDSMDYFEKLASTVAKSKNKK